ncbi:MAG: TetR family transcriptional regulator [Xanthobacteraceae bacterium]
MSGKSARDKILNAAEMLFAEHGLHAISLRRIAAAAAVPTGLIGYHFGSKDGLYRAVFERFSPTIVGERLAGLRLAEAEPDAERRLELIVKALVLPMVRLRTIDDQARFGRLMAREASDPNAFERGIIPQLFDPVAQEVVGALARAMPERSQTQIYWGYQFMLGALIFLMADTGRIERLSGGRCKSRDAESIARYLVPFLVAALCGGLAATPAGDEPLSKVVRHPADRQPQQLKKEAAHEARLIRSGRRGATRGRSG